MDELNRNIEEWLNGLWNAKKVFVNPGFEKIEIVSPRETITREFVPQCSSSWKETARVKTGAWNV